MLFEWDERKRQANLAKHRIDFQDVMRVFDGPVFERVDNRQGEERVVAIGSIEGIEIVVVYVRPRPTAADYLSQEGTSQ